MRPCLLLAAFFLALSLHAQQTLPANAAQTPDAKLCSIAGTVVRADTKAPLKKAHVALQSAESESHPFTATTDVSGHFQIDKIPPGSYHLEIERAGFVNLSYGQNSPESPGATLTLAPGQKMEDLLFRMNRSAVISGHITDEDGEPVPAASVHALRKLYLEGKPTVLEMESATTNDLGEYRLFGLPPGRFYVSATYQESDESFRSANRVATALASQDSGYAPTYYPGTSDVGAAAVIQVKSGDEVSSVDFSLFPTPVFHIRGKVTNSITGQPPRAVIIVAVPKAKQDYSVGGIRQALVTGVDGNFDIPGITPGSYSVTAIWIDQTKQHFAHQDVDVTNTDVEGLQLIISRGINIAGRVVPEGNTSEGNSDLRVHLYTREVNFSDWKSAEVHADGSFTIEDVAAGSYELLVQSSCKLCYTKSARFGSLDVLSNELSVGSGSSSSTLEIVYSANTATVNGSVTKDDGLPATGATVVLVPEKSFRNRAELFQNAATDQYGRFVFRGVPPGKYSAFAWQDIEGGMWQDPDFLKTVEGKGKDIELTEKQSLFLDLVALPSPSSSSTPDQ
ncbi:MAG: carboxypeptidase regulatory-like domain-containing protein [Candidatus Acidiferrales bacterium]